MGERRNRQEMTQYKPLFSKPPTAQERVLRELRRALTRGDLHPGAQILQDELAKTLGTSRVPVREALKILEGEGHIIHSPHRGYYVAELDQADLTEIYQIQRVLEAETVRHAMSSLGIEERARMQRALDDFQEAAEAGLIATMAMAYREFHFTLFEACGMPRLLRILRGIWDTSEVYRSSYFAITAYRADVTNELQEILIAVLAEDTSEVVEKLDRHRENLISSLRSIVNRRNSPLNGHGAAWTASESFGPIFGT